MQFRTLGHTGEKVSIVGLGGYHMAVPKDPLESIRIIRTAIDSGINFMDNCWDYHDGESERRMGKALRDGYRAKFSDDQTRQPYPRRRRKTDRRMPSAVTDGPYRSDAIP